MASYKNIFVEGELTLDELAELVKGMLDITQFHYDPESTMPYAMREEHTDIMIGENTFFSLDELNFEDFHYEIDVRGIGFRDSGDRSQWEYQRALYLFTHLKEIGKYRLMLTQDEQIKDEEFIPPKYQKPPTEYAIKAQTLPEEIIIRVVNTESVFIDNLEQILHTPSQKHVSVNGHTWYQLNDGKAQYDVRQTKLPGTYVINIEGRVFVPGERRYWQFESAHSLYEHLKATDKYKVQLQDGEEHIIEEYIPTQDKLVQDM